MPLLSTAHEAQPQAVLLAASTLPWRWEEVHFAWPPGLWVTSRAECQQNSQADGILSKGHQWEANYTTQPSCTEDDDEKTTPQEATLLCVCSGAQVQSGQNTSVYDTAWHAKPWPCTHSRMHPLAVTLPVVSGNTPYLQGLELVHVCQVWHLCMTP